MSEKRQCLDIFWMNFDELVRCQKMTTPVIPAKAGIQGNKHFWTPAFAGVTTFMTSYETITFGG